MGNVIRMACDCGEELVFEADADRVECNCGAVFAVTVSVLRPPAESRC